MKLTIDYHDSVYYDARFYDVDVQLLRQSVLWG